MVMEWPLLPFNYCNVVEVESKKVENCWTLDKPGFLVHVPSEV